MIKDNQSLKGVKSRFGNPIKVYDDGSGPLWVYREFLGIVGIVRCQTESDAWDCVCDEILTPVPLEDIKASPEDYYVCERDYHCKAPKDYEKGLCWCSYAEHSEYRRCWKCKQFYTPDQQKACNCTDRRELPNEVYLSLAEGCHYMPNFGGTSGIVQTDLNGSILEELTKEQVKEWEITLEIEEDE